MGKERSFKKSVAGRIATLTTQIKEREELAETLIIDLNEKRSAWKSLGESIAKTEEKWKKMSESEKKGRRESRIMNIWRTRYEVNIESIGRLEAKLGKVLMEIEYKKLRITQLTEHIDSNSLSKQEENSSVRRLKFSKRTSRKLSRKEKKSLVSEFNTLGRSPGLKNEKKDTSSYTRLLKRIRKVKASGAKGIIVL